jgi:hypothetical protein
MKKKMNLRQGKGGEVAKFRRSKSGEAEMIG